MADSGSSACEQSSSRSPAGSLHRRRRRNDSGEQGPWKGSGSERRRDDQCRPPHQCGKDQHRPADRREDGERSRNDGDYRRDAGADSQPDNRYSNSSAPQRRCAAWLLRLLALLLLGYVALITLFVSAILASAPRYASASLLGDAAEAIAAEAPGLTGRRWFSPVMSQGAGALGLQDSYIQLLKLQLQLQEVPGELGKGGRPLMDCAARLVGTLDEVGDEMRRVNDEASGAAAEVLQLLGASAEASGTWAGWASVWWAAARLDSGLYGTMLGGRHPLSRTARFVAFLDGIRASDAAVRVVLDVAGMEAWQCARDAAETAKWLRRWSKTGESARSWWRVWERAERLQDVRIADDLMDKVEKASNYTKKVKGQISLLNADWVALKKDIKGNLTAWEVGVVMGDGSRVLGTPMGIHEVVTGVVAGVRKCVF